MEEARALKEEYENKMKNVDKEAQAILDDARKRGMDNESRIISEAKEEAGRIIERARTEAELEKRKMADDVKREIITVASAMAGKVVAASINTKVQDDLIDSTLKEIGEGTWLIEELELKARLYSPVQERKIKPMSSSQRFRLFSPLLMQAPIFSNFWRIRRSQKKKRLRLSRMSSKDA